MLYSGRLGVLKPRVSSQAVRYSVTFRLTEVPRHARVLLSAAAGCLRLSSVLAELAGRQSQWTVLAVNAVYRVTRLLHGALPQTCEAAGGREGRGALLRSVFNADGV